MRTLPPCLLYSPDKELVSRLGRISSSVAAVHPIETQNDLEQRLVQFGNTILLADLRAPNCLEVLSEIKAARPLSIVIVMGADRSDPMLAAEWLDPFATTGLEPDRREFQSLLKQAVECFKLRQKNRVLEEELTRLQARKTEAKPQPRTCFSAPLQNFSKAQKNFDNLDVLFDSVVEGLVATARVSRAGIFTRSSHEDQYAFRAGMRCLQTTEALAIHQNDPFVRWMELHTHLISRQTLENIHDPEERNMLKQALDWFGAEIIIPLYASGRIQGWIFVGQRATGIPFEVADLEDLTGLADHISTTLEKAFQYSETALQKALAETLLHSIPFGIIACDENATIRWFNSTARAILETETAPVIGQSAESIGSHIADLLRRALENRKTHSTKEWTDPKSKRTLSAETHCLEDDGSCVGAMMMLHDITGTKLLQEKEEQLERAAFWTDLAASMSHEIRNPLVAIKTFSQLLPERYDDPGFRSEFGEQVSAEVDKLNQIIDKLNEFANLPLLSFKPLDVRKPIEDAVTRLQSELNHENLKIQLAADDSALQINGDASSLEECFYHLLRNAAENLNNKEKAHINVSVKERAPQGRRAQVFVIISDNGSGVDESVRDKLFSPFSTIKARGLGLGLPIAKRAVIDHNGQLDIETDGGGTSVIITLPALGDASET
ncbi:MAG: ATP-binding protein [Verrucomicrobiota bacterium]